MEIAVTNEYQIVLIIRLYWLINNDHNSLLAIAMKITKNVK